MYETPVCDRSNESFHLVAFLMLYKVVPNFKSVDETLDVAIKMNSSYWWFCLLLCFWPKVTGVAILVDTRE